MAPRVDRVTLAFCIGFRAWALPHLYRCLASIRRMTETAPIVVVDLGSEPVMLESVRAFGRSFDARVVSYPHPEWSRSLALNVAARQAPETETLVMTDADTLFPRHWLGVAQACAASHRLGLTRARDTVASQDLTAILDWSDDELARATRLHPEVGMGAAMVVPREWFFRVRGFDEVYSCWGCEDNDLAFRAVWDGLNVGWLDGAFVVHQYHRRDWPTAPQWERVERNRAYLAERCATQGPIERNPGGWGGVKV